MCICVYIHMYVNASNVLLKHETNHEVQNGHRRETQCFITVQYWKITVFDVTRVTAKTCIFILYINNCLQLFDISHKNFCFVCSLYNDYSNQ